MLSINLPLSFAPYMLSFAPCLLSSRSSTWQYVIKWSFLLPLQIAATALLGRQDRNKSFLGCCATDLFRCDRRDLRSRKEPGRNLRARISQGCLGVWMSLTFLFCRARAHVCLKYRACSRALILNNVYLFLVSFSKSRQNVSLFETFLSIFVSRVWYLLNLHNLQTKKRVSSFCKIRPRTPPSMFLRNASKVNQHTLHHCWAGFSQLATFQPCARDLHHDWTSSRGEPDQFTKTFCAPAIVAFRRSYLSDLELDAFTTSVYVSKLSCALYFT